MIKGTEFNMTAGASVDSVEKAIAWVKPLFSPEARIAIHSLTYDTVGSYGNPSARPVAVKIIGQAWIGEG